MCQFITWGIIRLRRSKKEGLGKPLLQLLKLGGLIGLCPRGVGLPWTPCSLELKLNFQTKLRKKWKRLRISWKKWMTENPNWLTFWNMIHRLEETNKLRLVLPHPLYQLTNLIYEEVWNWPSSYQTKKALKFFQTTRVTTISRWWLSNSDKKKEQETSNQAELCPKRSLR